MRRATLSVSVIWFVAFLTATLAAIRSAFAWTRSGESTTRSGLPRLQHVAGLRDQTNDPSLEGREDRGRPIFVERDPAYRRPLLPEGAEPGGLDLEASRLGVVHRDDVRIRPRTPVGLTQSSSPA